MAIVEFINKPNRTYAGMRKVINYILDPNKTNENLTFGIGINPNHAFNEFVALKQIMGKTDKRLWYHFVQSFPPYDNITPKLALEVALKTAEYWKDEYQMLIAVHQDKEHIHAHFVMNTVNIETGKKYTQNNQQRLEIQALSDKICEQYGLHILSDEQKNTGKYKKSGEYRAEQKGQSWKADLKTAIDTALHSATNKEHFIKLMNAQDYKVKWTDTRENITFITPSGMRCRDRKLGEPDYYNKHNFEMIFEQNAHSGIFTENEDVTMSIPHSVPALSEFFGGKDTDIQAVFDGFMLRDIDFDGMSSTEIKQTIERLRNESATRKSRALANQNKQEQQATKQEFWQRMELLDELEKRLMELTQRHQYSYEQNRDDEMDIEM